jgi:hypothetical protein
VKAGKANPKLGVKQLPLKKKPIWVRKNSLIRWWLLFINKNLLCVPFFILNFNFGPQFQPPKKNGGSNEPQFVVLYT